MSVIRWLTVALLLAFCTNKVQSDASDHKYKPTDEVPIYANKVGPFHNPRYPIFLICLLDLCFMRFLFLHLVLYTASH
ncbi:putative nonaspanin (TM9SF) [Helianthus debilis subsp. tardiflorus]